MSEPRTYGNWRKARGLGLAGLSPGQTLTLTGAVLVTILAMLISPRLALAAVVAAAVLAAAVLARMEDQSLADALGRRLRFHRASRAGLLQLSGGLLTEHPRAADLPGPMAVLVPLTTDDGRGGKQCLMWDRACGRLTAIVRIAPVGLDLADQAQADQWVAGFGAFLADLGYQPLVRHVSVTVDTAPSGGTTLCDYLAARLDPGAPAGARAVMGELAAASPAGAADAEAWVAVTMDPRRASPPITDLLAGVAEVTHCLPRLEAGLASCGVAVLGRATVEWITERLRVAYDPVSRATAHRVPDEDEASLWAEAGPVAAVEEWDCWRHDSGVSVSWGLAEPPRQPVTDRVLIPLLSPGPWPRRVTLLYESYGAAEAAAEVEREVTAAHFRSVIARRTRRDETQRERTDSARAVQAAREEAAGAGVLRFSLYVTTTVLGDYAPAQLSAAIADVGQRAALSKLRLRCLRSAQAAGFAATLGMGVNPRELARRPR